MVDWNPYYLFVKSLGQNGISQEEIQEVKAALDQEPYYSLLHYLSAKYDQSPNHLFKASAYSANRALLKKFLDGKIYPPPLLDALFMEESHSRPLPQPLYQKDPNLFSMVDFETEAAQEQVLALPFNCHGAVASPIDVHLDNLILEKKIKYADLASRIRLQLEKFQRKDRSEAIIDRFLANPPKSRPKRNIVPLNTHPKVEDVTEELDIDDEPISESLARLHVKQQNLSEAIRIYQKLRLRFPEKSAYFDAQIQQIST